METDMFYWCADFIKKKGDNMEQDDFKQLINESQKEIEDLEKNSRYYSQRMAEYGGELTEKYKRISVLKLRIENYNEEISELAKYEKK